MYSYGPPHMAEQKQDDQHEHTFSKYVRIRDVVKKTCQRRWTIGKSGERGSGISVLPARHDDDREAVRNKSDTFFSGDIWKLSSKWRIWKLDYLPHRSSIQLDIDLKTPLASVNTAVEVYRECNWCQKDIGRRNSVVCMLEGSVLLAAW